MADCKRLVKKKMERRGKSARMSLNLALNQANSPLMGINGVSHHAAFAAPREHENGLGCGYLGG
jgi:hypothetical protein